MVNATDERINEVLAYCNDHGEYETLRYFPTINIETLHRYQRERKWRDTINPKILLLDIETARMIFGGWRLGKQRVGHEQVVKDWFMLGWACKWLFSAEVMSDFVTSEEAIARDDKRICESLWSLVDQADIICSHNGCVTPGHRVLKSDLTWELVENLKEGDKLLAFNENPATDCGEKSTRKFEISTVEKVCFIEKECSQIELEDGTKLTASNDHPWLVKRNGQHWKYKETQQLLKARGDATMSRVFDVWNREDNYHSGYLAAFLDGEGCLLQSKRKDRIHAQYSLSISFTQKDQIIIQKLCESLDYFNFKYSISPYDRNHADIMKIDLRGGMREKIRFLGIVNAAKSSRLDENKFEGMLLHCTEKIKIKNISPVGIRTVVGLQTSSKTYIVDGFPCHNSRFDLPKINSRFLLNGLKPPMPYQSIDTYKIAYKQFGFSSNALNYLGKIMLNKEKIHTDYQLWIDCENGDEKALKDMETYCKGDVSLLEDVYVELRPWIKSHPNLAILMDAKEQCCPNCGGFEFEEGEGYYTTPQNKYISVRCKTCGAVNRKKASEITADQRKVMLIPNAR